MATGFHFFLSSFAGLTLPSTNGVFSLTPSANAIEPIPTATAAPIETTRLDYS